MNIAQFYELGDKNSCKFINLSPNELNIRRVVLLVILIFIFIPLLYSKGDNMM